MSRKDVRNVLNSKVKEFQKAHYSPIPIDAFQLLFVQVYYDSDDKVKKVVFVPGSNPVLKNVCFFEHNIDSLGQAMNKLGDPLIPVPSGVRFDKSGIALYAPSVELEIESVDAYCHHAYRKLCCEWDQKAASRIARAESLKKNPPSNPFKGE
jgi:hypothetical protein